MALKKATNAVSQEDTSSEKFSLATEGLYRHPETGAELAAFYDPITGNAQAQGLTRVGFERVGDVPTGYDKTIVVNHDFASDAAKGPVLAMEEQMRGIMARVRELEAEKQVAEADAAKADDNSGDNIPELNTEGVQAAAAENVASRLENADNSANDNAGVNAQEQGVNSVSEDNKKTNKKESK